MAPPFLRRNVRGVGRRNPPSYISSNINLRGRSATRRGSRSRSRASSRRSTSTMSWSDVARDAAMAGASMVLNSQLPGAGDALSYAHYRPTQSRLNNRRRTAAVRGGSSVYAGRMRKAKRVKGDPFVKNGFKHVVETSGVVTDPDCVYVGHSTYIPRLVMQMVAQCILRKLFEKANHTVTSIIDPLYPQSNNSGGKFFIKLDMISSQGVLSNVEHEVVQTSNIQLLTGDFVNGVAPQWSDFLDALFEYSVGSLANDDMNTKEPYQIRLFQEVFNTSGSKYHLATLNLRDMYVRSFFASTIKIQNRTLAANGDDDSEAVSANPLYLHKYLFSGPQRQRDKTSMFRLPIAETGVLTIGAGNGANQYMREPPSPKLFWNCYKHARDLIQPGSIKSDKISLGKNMKLLRYLKWIGVLQDDAGGGPKTNDIKGPFMMYALEDVINVNFDQVISIAYEVNRTLGMYVYSKKTRFASGGVYQQSQDNEYIPPIPS